MKAINESSNMFSSLNKVREESNSESSSSSSDDGSENQNTARGSEVSV